jgi:molybdenum cofactor synthesis domain-containing protein
VGEAELVEEHGIRGDAHAGNWHRQVSLLSLEKINAFRARGAEVADGAFGENLIVEGLDTAKLPQGTVLNCSGGAVLKITQKGKECHNHCAIFEAMGDCIMPREGIFARVLKGGRVKTGDSISAVYPYRTAVITASDRSFRGEREDKSGPEVKRIALEAGYSVEHCVILPDEEDLLEAEIRRLADGGLADLILTTGGTGFSPRDRTPEATLAAADRVAPGIAEAMRASGMAITRRAMLSRGVSAIRGRTLIINLPGSPKAARENLECVISEIRHGLDVLTGIDGE